MSLKSNNLPQWDVIVSDFRVQMSEFEDSDIFPDALILRALKMTKFYFGKRWGDYAKDSNMQWGWFNYVAHAILVTMRKQTFIAAGKAPTAIRGANTVTIGDETVVYGSQIYMRLNPWDEELASNSYGIEYLRRRAMIKPIGFVV